MRSGAHECRNRCRVDEVIVVCLCNLASDRIKREPAAL